MKNTAQVIKDELQTASTAPQLEMLATDQRKYRYWRIRVLYATILGYAAFYLVRMNFAMVNPTLISEFGYSKAQLGSIATAFSIIYGFGKFFNGYISDHSNGRVFLTRARFFMAFGLLGSGLVNIFIGFWESLLMLGIFWGVNGWFQSMGWPPVARLLTHWYSPKEIGTKWGMWSASHQIGTLASTILAGYLIKYYSWQAAFLVPGILSMIGVFFLINRLRDTPSSVGLPPIEVYKKLSTDNLEAEDENLSHKELLGRVVKNKLVWCTCMANMSLYTVRFGVLFWAPTMLQEMKGSQLLTYTWQTVALEIGGLLGGLFAGFISDRVFKGRRGPVSVIYMTGLVAALLYFWYAPAGYSVLDAAILWFVGFLVSGPQVLAGISVTDFASKKAAGLATGLNGTFGYLGAAISGVGVGKMVDLYGWDGGFLLFVGAAILGIVFFALTWHGRSAALENTSK
ncbi:MAG: MFS transporter [Alphaproteobacteria bacterium]